MKLLELFTLRECFWQAGRQEIVWFRKLMQEDSTSDSMRGCPDKVLAGLDKFLNDLLKNAQDPELCIDLTLKLDIIAKANNTPFANL